MSPASAAASPPSTAAPTRIAVIGAAGRMGRALVRALAEAPGASLTTAVGRPGSADLAADAGVLAGVARLGVELRSRLPGAGEADVWIDCSSPPGSVASARAAVTAGARLVVATTGLGEGERASLTAAAIQIPLILAPNTSIGVTVLLQVVADAARALGSDYDVQILEAHHRAKRDAPSGTALRLAEALAGGRLQAIRGGDVIGDHTVFFLGDGDRLEITHRASSRDTFARGALRAALWLAARGRAPGLYDMRDVLGLR
jgi:4-hydroxy-tetrahydrodipicolinate reductase